MATPAIPPDIAKIAGPILLADFIHWGLFGILTVQVYLYHLAFPRDSTPFKALVYIIYLIEIAQTLLLTHDAFYMYARHFGDVSALDSVQTGWLAVPVLSGIVSCAVQLCYTYRIYVLSKSKALTLGISVIALTQAVAGIIGGAQAHLAAKYSLVNSKAFVAITIWLSGSALCDLVIAASMTVLLKRGDSGIRATHALISKLIRLIIETGSLTALMAIAEVACFFALPHLNYYVCLAIIRAKLYSNSLLVVFNSRLRIGDQTNSIFVSHIDSGNATYPEFAVHETSRGMNSIVIEDFRGKDEHWTDNVRLSSMDNKGPSSQHEQWASSSAKI
ncbi:uncharacterized protein FOMMEDRAFT_141125 [Fomitiporia mediterranea MF3/22]|uniref:uncharacterized protein n=1 Tax=Fomitiporia mediterranea (strain MF3/22) TaxID=694068 RepID=UPI0004408C86|nr:uncharacterized protein FOMMEDRAFT_141125 [Fomitiporia mediterranea MF3/22]EJD01895.1 hypothetical protein FOMMEDRAFT_141125 [Fomitiporia mediterranea MF3/22]